MFEVPGATPHFRTELAAQLAELVPEAVADGKLDIEKLRELLADDVADGNERFGLFWPGKKRALRAAQAPTTATLKPDFAHSKDWDTTQNVFIEGDNLEVLKTLQRHYHNKIKLIYIDPPYNTGKDFVYPDNFKEGLDTYLEWTRQVNEEGKKISTNSETEGRYHSNWLNMMYPRLKLARNLLTDDGVIFISIDDREFDNLRKVCNEVFGESNFVALLTVLCNPKGRSQDKFFATNHEYIAVYSRKTLPKGYFSIAKDEDQIEDEYPEEDDGGKYRLLELRNTHREFGRHNRKNLFYPFYVDSEGEVSLSPDDEQTKVLPIWDDGFEGCWTWEKPKAELDLSLLVGRFVSDRWKIYRKSYANGSNRMLKTILMDKSYFTERGQKEFGQLFGVKAKLFQSPKSPYLLSQLIRTITTNDDYILDFFAGSSSSAHAVMTLNAEDGGKRRFIMVQLPEPTPEESEARKAGFKTIADISRKRIELAGEKIKQDAGLLAQHLDTGFRAYKLADTNFSKWRVTSDVAVNELEQHLLDLRDSADDEAQADDLLTELLLKLGYSLTEPIHTETIAGLEVRKVGDNGVLAYLNEHTKPTLAQLRALVEAAPARIIVLEDAFQGDDELKTNLAQHAKSRGIELWTA
ncbi:MAG: site-specific DNA-methyltransferase [Nitrosomonadales bacterium]|nr:site-specific DNA-methyltransferase [Nitrosomonadales bacterium]